MPLTDFDATQFLVSLAQHSLQLNDIVFRNLKFSTEFGQEIKLPESLLFLDVSSCRFTPKSFTSFLRYLTSSPVGFPFILRMRNIDLLRAHFEEFQNMDFKKMTATICEIDWSQNNFPRENIKYFFDFCIPKKIYIIFHLMELRHEKMVIFFHA